MAIKVDNLNNLFWDNGSWKFPNTYPHLVNGKYLENVTPVMTSPITGRVVLEGEYNYCEFKGELFFLKKDILISLEKNKWRYILIKDHVCSLYKNRANVIAAGTLINTDLDKLKPVDFQFTYPVFNSFNKRILLPLAKEAYSWKKHIIPVLPNKVFEDRYTIDDVGFSRFLLQLENNKKLLKDQQFKKSNYFTLLGKAELNKKTRNWKNELVDKIKDLLNDLNKEEVVLVKINDVGKGKCLHDKYAISYKTSHSLGKDIEQFKQVLSLDLSGLTDIELISQTKGEVDDNTIFRVKLKQTNVQEQDYIAATCIKKLSRRPRVSFLNRYSTRAIYERTGKLQTWYTDDQNKEIFLPQKVFFEIKNPLRPKKEWATHFPSSRKNSSFRSVYLYYCENFNFLYQFKQGAFITSSMYDEHEFIDSNKFLTDESEKSIAKHLLRSTNGVKVIKPPYDNWYPWKTLKKRLNIGWLIGQFSLWIENQDTIFEEERPFIVKQNATTLTRIKGLNQLVSKLIQNSKAYEEESLREEEKEYKSELDIFNTLPARARQTTKEEDFLIGEKMLFSTWGAGVYLMFQPVSFDGYYNRSKLTKTENLIAKWLKYATWYYGYYMFDDGHYTTDHSKQWIRDGKEGFKPIAYQRFYENDTKYKKLEEHIKKNTKYFFITEKVELKDTPIKDLKKNDIFFSDLDYYFYDHSETHNLEQNVDDWFIHEPDMNGAPKDGEVVVYADPEKDGELCIGIATVWDTETILPDNQFIAEGNAINDDSSANNKVRNKVTRIRKRNTKKNYKNFEEIINDLKERPEEFFAYSADFKLDELGQTGTYLFDLKGTDFYCYLDQQSKVHLIFKDEKYIKTSDKQIYTISASETISKLDRTQWVNQKLVLSLYGHKIDIPTKAIENRAIVNIEVDTADLTEKTGVYMDSHKVEVTHALGKTYLRFDTSKAQTKSTTAYNAYEVERMDISNMRAFQDYLNSRRIYELEYESMDLQHQRMRLENKAQWWNDVMSVVWGAAGVAAGIAALALSGGAGAALAGGAGAAAAAGTAAGKIAEKTAEQAVSMSPELGNALTSVAKTTKIKGALKMSNMLRGITGGIINLSYYGARTANMEAQIANSIEQKVMESYSLDLSNDRRKEDYRFELRKAFAQESINIVPSRERNQLLDDKEADLKGLKSKDDKEIYVELWTISDKQKEYIADYHEKFGVDCRVSNSFIPIGNGIKEGIYKFEDVEILNLKNRIDLILIKGLLESGIKIVKWVEHESVEELIPEDPRMQKLRDQVTDLLALKDALEKEKEELKVRIGKLNLDLIEARNEEERLTNSVKEKEANIKQNQVKIRTLEQNISSQNEKYHTLSNNFRDMEEKYKEEEKQKKLYLAETQTLRQQKQQEKEKLERKQRELEAKINEIEKQLTETQLQLNESKRIEQELKNTHQDNTEKLNSEIEKLKKEIEKCKEDGKKTEEALAESEKSLAAVREIEADLRKQLAAEGKGRTNLLPLESIIHFITKYVPRATNGILYHVVKKGNGFDILEWDSANLRFEIKSKKKIWIYDYYRTYLISDYLDEKVSLFGDDGYFFKTNGYDWSYHNKEIKEWYDVKEYLISYSEGNTAIPASNAGLRAYYEDYWYVPYFEEKNRSEIEESDRVQNAGGVAYFSYDKSSWVSAKDKNEGNVKQIKTYGEYLDLMGLKWENSKVVSK